MGAVFIAHGSSLPPRLQASMYPGVTTEIGVAVNRLGIFSQ